jgi:hypothetical protein
MRSLTRNVFLLFYSINFTSVDLYYGLILISKFIKHNHANDLYCNIKYTDLNLSLNFLSFFLLLLMIFFFYLHKLLSVYLIRYLQGFFIYTLIFLENNLHV